MSKLGKKLIAAANEGIAIARGEVRAKVHALEAAMLEMEQVELPVFHHFSPGVYARELHIPKGTVLTGKVHKYAQLNIMSAGDMTVMTDNGPIRVKAGFHIVSPAGTKRAAYAHEDTVWTTVHGTEETDVEKIEAHFIAQDDAEYLAHCEMLQIGTK